MKLAEVETQLRKISSELGSIIFPVVGYRNDQKEMMQQVINQSKEKAETIQRVIDDVIDKMEDN